MKFHLILLLDDRSLIVCERDIPSQGSVSRVLMEIAKNRDVFESVPHITSAIRILDDAILVDDRDRILRLLGYADNKPKELQDA